MGTYNKGILGAFSGKVGPVVGANWRGKDVLRSLPKKSKKEPTDLQLLQRQKFSYVTAFLTPLAPVLGRYFGQQMGDRSKRNIAMSYHMSEAMLYNGMEWEMFYPKVQISKGDLLGLLAPTVVAEAGGVFRVTWTDNSGQASAKPDDQLIAVVYDIDNHTSDVFFNLAESTATEAVLQLQRFMIGARVHCWIVFVAAN